MRSELAKAGTTNHVALQANLALPPRFADTDQNGIVNDADIDRLADIILELYPAPSASLTPIVTSPVMATNGSSVTLTGTLYPTTPFRIEGGTTAITNVAGNDGQFAVTVGLVSNRLNLIYVSGIDETGAPSAPAPLRILQDSQPPSLFIDFPTNGQTLTTSNSVIAGRVGDMLSGFMGLNVFVHSSPSEGAPLLGGAGGGSSGSLANVVVGIGNNGTYERTGVPLALGTNIITVTSSDMHGNSITRTSIIYRLPLTGPRVVALSGDGQMTNVSRRLAEPIVVRLTQEDGVTPIANKLVDFQVTRNDGRLLPVSQLSTNNPQLLNDITRTTNGTMHLQLLTDANGEASVWWTLGGAAGCGNNRLCVTSASVSNSVFFCASSKPNPARQINIGSGNNQRVEAGGPAMEPFRAWVSDSCNGVEGIPVTFTVVQGGGRLFPSPGGEGQGEGGSTVTVLSSRTGHAEVLYQLGPDPGNNLIEATFPGNPGNPATFVLYGVARDPSAPTTFSGLVLDNASQPIGGAHCVLTIGGVNFETHTDSQGQFRFNASTF